jgi:hypothetical protein
VNHGRVDADDSPATVDQRTTRVSGIRCRIRLNDVVPVARDAASCDPAAHHAAVSVDSKPGCDRDDELPDAKLRRFAGARGNVSPSANDAKSDQGRCRLRGRSPCPSCNAPERIRVVDDVVIGEQIPSGETVPDPVICRRADAKIDNGRA